MRRLAVLLAASLVAAPAMADSPPPVWERARNPEAAAVYELHVAVQRRLIPTPFGEVNDAELLQVLAMLERAGAEHSTSALLRLDLAYVHASLKNHARAARLYKAAIAEFPDHPAMERAWIRLAFSCGHLGDHACERDAYREVLRIETEEVYRATPTLNLAETQMHLGELKDAIEGYREALRLAGRVPARETAPLATWGLAVALDRAGDRIGSEREARFALEIERSMGIHRLLRSEYVFFVPAYEIHWYEGLGAAARARVAPSAREAAALWREAEKSFGDWVNGAEPKNDRWLPMGKWRLANARAERERAERGAPRRASEAADPTGAVRL